MMAGKRTTTVASRICMALVVAAFLVAGAAAEMDCSMERSSLAPCLKYVTGRDSTPSNGCCKKVSKANAMSPACLCAMIAQLNANPSVNSTKASALPRDCGVAVDPSLCPAFGQPPSPSNPPPPPPAKPPVSISPPPPVSVTPPPPGSVTPPSPVSVTPPPVATPTPLPLIPSPSSPSGPTFSAPGDPLSSQAAPSYKSQAGLIAGLSAALGGVLLGLFVFFYMFRHRKNLKAASKNSAGFVPAELSPDTSSRAYTFKELSTITKNFNPSELLASGTFGEVYKGTPLAGSSLVAVKRIRRDKDYGQASFLAEANSLRQIRHRNLLQLRGWCEAKEGLFLVYDFMSNGSLDEWLHHSPNPNPLPWNVRRSILVGVASGLEYLHEGWVQCVLHRDVKSGNVMLDADFNPTLGDFGLARLVDHRKTQKTTMVAGTIGYMAPELHSTGRATKETDVYAFGVLILEVVCGRWPFVNLQDGDAPGDPLLLERVWRAHEAGDISEMIDSRLRRSCTRGVNASSELVMMARYLQMGLLSCLPNPRERPSIRLVGHWFQSLEMGTMEIPPLPAAQPAPPARYVLPQPSEGTSSSHSSSDKVPFGHSVG